MSILKRVLCGIAGTVVAVAVVAPPAMAMDVQDVVGYAIQDLTPTPGTVINPSGRLPVSFRVADANGPLSDAASAAILPGVVVALDITPVPVSYSTKTHQFWTNIHVKQATIGEHDLLVMVTVGGTVVASTTVVIQVT
ncbi:MAG TPA: hypothetical protein VFJ85_06245 [Acidimicrobiales bacterium]|nr:hypothetical protein [Acidimicrobiales bacterium]